MIEVAILGVLAVTLLAAVVMGRRMSVRFGRFEATLQGVDKAVNGRPPGDPTLYEQVAHTAADIEECKAQLCSIDGKVDGHLEWHANRGT